MGMIHHTAVMHPTATVDATATLGAQAIVGSFGGVMIGNYAFVGNRTRLSSHTIVGVGATPIVLRPLLHGSGRRRLDHHGHKRDSGGGVPDGIG